MTYNNEQRLNCICNKMDPEDIKNLKKSQLVEKYIFQRHYKQPVINLCDDKSVRPLTRKELNQLLKEHNKQSKQYSKQV